MASSRLWAVLGFLSVLGGAHDAARAAPDPDSRAHPRVQSALELLDRWIDARQAYHQIPGISIAIVHDQDVIFSRGYGAANVRSGSAATPDTLYSICSISKLFTSIAVMQQRDAGRLRLSDPVEQHLDWFNVANTFPESGPVTIEGLLTHSSGLPRESDFPYWSGPDFPFPSRAAVMERLGEQETLYPSASFFQYSNLGLTLAGEIVTVASGEPFADYVRAEILEPLALQDTQPNFRTDEHGRRLAIGYGAQRRDGTRAPLEAFATRAITPAAGFTSSALDLARFASWQFRLLEQGGTEVLDANTLREMQRVHWVDPDWKVTWGLGFAVRKSDHGTLVSHGGGCPGYSTSFTLLPSRKLGAIVMINASGVDPNVVVASVFDALVPALKAAEEPPEDTLPDYSQYAGVYDTQPWGGEAAVVPWGDQLAVVALPNDKVMEGLTKLEHVDGHRFRRIREDDDGEGEIWTFEVNDSGIVTGFTRHSNTRPKVR